MSSNPNPTLSPKGYKTKRAGDVAQTVECLPRILKALGSISCMAKQTNKQKKKKRGKCWSKDRISARRNRFRKSIAQYDYS
jgi:hypothetical protein